MGLPAGMPGTFRIAGARGSNRKARTELSPTSPLIRQAVRSRVDPTALRVATTERAEIGQQVPNEGQSVIDAEPVVS